MIVPNMIYDIRTTENAQKTLVNLTGVSIPIWEQFISREREYEYTEDLVYDVIKSYGNLPSNYRDFKFVYAHITTSANKCESFYKHGILDLKQSYLCHDSELREFLEMHDIHIDLNEQILKYNRQVYDISYRTCPRKDTEAYKCWSIGRKFYYDYNTCGFLSVRNGSPYGGQVHQRPEILMDIDELLGLSLSREWMFNHESYVIVAKVNGENIIYHGYDEESDEDKVLNYLTKAYMNAFYEPNEKILLIKSKVQIPPCDILDIKPMLKWENL